MADEELTLAEKEQLSELLGYGSNIQDGKHSVHSFLNNVAMAQDTTKLGNLSSIELGNLETPVRALKFVASYMEDIMNKKEATDWFKKQSENATATSLSKDALLLRLAVTQKKEFGDIAKAPRKENKSWFKKKDDGGTVEPST